MRSSKHRLAESFGDGLAHPRQLHVSVSLALLGAGGGGLRRGGCPGLGCGLVFLDVGFDDTAAGTGAFELFEGDAAFEGQAAGDGGGMDWAAEVGRGS